MTAIVGHRKTSLAEAQHVVDKRIRTRTITEQLLFKVELIPPIMITIFCRSRVSARHLHLQCPQRDQVRRRRLLGASETTSPHQILRHYPQSHSHIYQIRFAHLLFAPPTWPVQCTILRSLLLLLLKPVYSFVSCTHSFEKNI